MLYYVYYEFSKKGHSLLSSSSSLLLFYNIILSRATMTFTVVLGIGMNLANNTKYNDVFL
jgi:hypothetical protein